MFVKQCFIKQTYHLCFPDDFIQKYKKKLQNNLASEKFNANTSSY